MDKLKKVAETVEAVAWAAVSIIVLKFVWVFCLAGWSDSVLQTMTNLEADPQAFIKEIENVKF